MPYAVVCRREMTRLPRHFLFSAHHSVHQRRSSFAHARSSLALIHLQG
jgi:hypothetical protein